MRKAIAMLIVLTAGISLWGSEVDPAKSVGYVSQPKHVPSIHRDIPNDNNRGTYTIDLYDSYGDGWNGGASVDVLINGVVYYDDIYVPTGYGPTSFPFDVVVGDVITTEWNAGSWDGECSYEIYNDANFLVASSEGSGSSTAPPNISYTAIQTHIAVYFSEYSEGASQNKYLEIYNGTDAAVDLTGLAFPNSTNGSDGTYEYWNSFPDGATVAAGEVYVIAADGSWGTADAAIIAEADHTFQYLSNGDDGFCLVLGGTHTDTDADGNIDAGEMSGYTILDCIGDWNDDPGSGWEVAGTANATKDNTLERKGDVIFGNGGDWATSAGTNIFDSEYTVSANTFGGTDGAQDGDWDGLGTRVPTEVLGCTDATASNYDATATIDDGSCVLTPACETNDLLITMTDTPWDDSWNGNVLTIGDVTFDGPPSGGSPSTASLCLEDGIYTVTCGGGSWMSEVGWVITNATTGEELLAGGAPYDGVLMLGDVGVAGCTDPTAVNYNPDATADDGTCYFAGETCDAPLDFVTEGGALDGSTSATGSIEAGGSMYYSFTLDQAWDYLDISLEGSNFDTKLDLYDPGCGTLQGTNDDNGAGGLWSAIYLANVPAGSHVVKVYGWSTSAGNYVLNINAYEEPVSVTDLAASSGLQRVYLQWSPLNPNAGAEEAMVMLNNDYDAYPSIEEFNQAQIDKKNYYASNSVQSNQMGSKTMNREQLMLHIESDGQTRDMDVIITFFDSWGDGHCGDVYIKDANGVVVESITGGWYDAEAAFGPFTMADGTYTLEWSQEEPAGGCGEWSNGLWLGEQSAEITDASDATVVLLTESPAPGPHCFAVGEGYVCGSVDLAVTSVHYDSFTGALHATVANIGDLDAPGAFWVTGYLSEPDPTLAYPAGFFSWAQVAELAAGESAEIALTGGNTLTELFGYNGESYTIYAYADGGAFFTEPDRANNVGMTEVVNTSPLANTSFSVWRDAGTEPIASVSASDWLPGSYMQYVDLDVAADTEYCYLVTQVDGTSESGVSNQSCATPSAPPPVPAPSDLAGSSAGFNVELTWTSAPPIGDEEMGVGIGTPSLTRQGGDEIGSATVITELTQLTGTTLGDEYYDDYDEDCGSGDGSSPDVVYSFTPAEDMAVDVTTCYSNYDTKIFVYENSEGVLAGTVNGGPASACSDDDDWPVPDGEAPCTDWTSYIPGLYMTAGNTYYIIIDGWGAGSAGDYVIDFYPYEPFQGYSIWSQNGEQYNYVGQAGRSDTLWSSVLFAPQPADVNLTITADYKLLGIVDMVRSTPLAPVTLPVQMEDNPNNLAAMDEGNNVHLMWEPPIDAGHMELVYHDGSPWTAYRGGYAVAVRFRVFGTYAVKKLANAVWTADWPDYTLGQTPFTLSIHAVDPVTDMPGEVLFTEDVLVDADPTSDYYGWAMTSGLDDTPLTVTGDVFVSYSNFGWDFANNTSGPDMDMMTCDAILDFPGNRYSGVGEGLDLDWELDVVSGRFDGCGDWLLHMHADFTAGEGFTTAGNGGIWIDQSGSPSLESLPTSFASFEAVNTKENPVELTNAPASYPLPNSLNLDRDMMHYNIYRDGEVVGSQQPGVHEYMDGGLDWGIYTYHVTAMYDDHESIATNMVEVELSNVPPNATRLISPGEDFLVEVNEDNLDATVPFIWTAAIDNDNDPVEYWLNAEGLIGTDTVYGGAPDFHMENEGFEDGMENWLVWPTDVSNHSIEATGNGIHNSDDTFEALEGMYSLKIWGQNGETFPNETSVYQGYNVEGAGLSAGDHVVAFGAMMSHADDWVGQGGNSAYLFISFFDDGWNMMQSTLGPLMDASKTASEWHEFDVRAEVPAGAVNMNVGVAYYQISGNDHGSVYFDEVDWYSPLMSEGIFIPYEDLAMDAFEAGVTDITWEWDVWTFDGYEATPSSNGPRQIHVNIANLLGIDNVSLPKEFALHNNYPNPFNPVTNITYDIPEATDVTLEIYNVMGQRVRTLAQGNHEPGRYQVVWSATDDIGQALSSGMYIYRIQAGDFVSVKKLVLMK